MKMPFRYILTLIFLLVPFLVASAQDTASLDAELDRYEVLCGMCMDLRTRINEGESVSRSEAQAFINRFLSMNRTLKEKEAEMTAVQRKRFASIGQWFSTGVKPQLPLPVEPVEPFVYNGRIEVLSTNDGPMFPAAVPVVELPDTFGPDKEIILLAEMAVPSMSYGLRAGLMKGRFGGYVSFRSDFRPDDYSYTCRSDGTLEGGGVFWSGGESRSSSLSVNAGLLMKVAPWLSGYVGAGYGRSSYMWQDLNFRWVQVSDISYRGLAAEAGVVLSFNDLVFSAGLSSVSFRTLDFTFGVGISF